MTLLKLALKSLTLLTLIWTTYSLTSLYINYKKAQKIGIPIRIIPIDHLNKLWLLVDKQVVALVKRLPGKLGNNNFTRYNFRGWHEKDGTRTHDELGPAFVLCTPSRNWVYVADPEALVDLYRRGRDFPRWVEITKVLDVFGGPNIATASGDHWRQHRKIVDSCLNEQTNQIVWKESVSLAAHMARYWASKQIFTSVGEDTRTVTLHVLTKACFGQSYPFEGHDERLPTSPSTSFRFSLVTVMENALLILALGPAFFTKTSSWRLLPLPRSWRELGDACLKFRSHMTFLYNQKVRSFSAGNLDCKKDPTLMASLIRASQGKEGDKENGGFGLAEAEIYGTMFVLAFAGHDTTAHALTYAVMFMAANPDIQDWIAEELNRVLGDKPQEEWDYHRDFPKLKRCMAILYETLRVKTPVPEVKWTSGHSQTLNVRGHDGQRTQTLAIPPETLIMPSYLYAHKHTSFWGPDAHEWRPSRWIGKRQRKTQGHGVETEEGEEREEEEFIVPPPSQGNFLGWSLGARNCPGKRFSQVEWVAFMAALFRDWRVELLPTEDDCGRRETAEEARIRVLEFIERDSDYGGMLLQLMHPERVPLVWRAR